MQLPFESGAVEELEAAVASAFDRITFDPAIMIGRACIRGMRILGEPQPRPPVAQGLRGQ